MPDWASYVLAAAAGYFIGAIPFGLVLVRAAGLGDIRKIGSGNIGATNVLRTGRKDLAFATLALDMFKAGLVALVFWKLFEPSMGHDAAKGLGMFAGAAAFIGHCYPIYLGFKGGKGVGTYAGLVAATTLGGFVVGAPMWIGIFALTRISSLAALITSFCIPLALVVFSEVRDLRGLAEPDVVPAVLAALTILLFWRHRENIRRLMHGVEPRFGKK